MTPGHQEQVCVLIVSGLGARNRSGSKRTLIGAVASLCLAPRNMNVEAYNAYRENGQENLKMNDVDNYIGPHTTSVLSLDKGRGRQDTDRCFSFASSGVSPSWPRLLEGGVYKQLDPDPCPKS